MNKDAIREYWDNKPCNAWWNEMGWNITAHKHGMEPHIWEWSDFPRWEGRKVLDLGCGIGTMAIEFAKAGAGVIAVDISGESILQARDRAQEAGVDIWWVNQDLEVLDLLAWQRSNDLAYSFGVLHHTPNPLAALRRAWYHLQPHGELWIMVYHRWGWKRLTRGRPEAQPGCPLVTYWTPRTITRLLRQASFEPYEFRVAHIFPWKGEEYGRGQFKVAFPWSLPGGGKLREWIEPIFGQHLLVKARKA